MGMLKGGSKRSLLQIGLTGLLCLSASLASASESCHAIFTGGLQTHGAGGVVFRQKATLLNNPASLLDTARIEIRSSLPTCERQACQASGQAAGDLGELAYPDFTGQQDLRVDRFASTDVGSEGQSRFRDLQLEAGAQLAFSPQNQAYFIERLSLAHGARAILAPGRYWIGRLEMAPGSELQVASGTAKLMLATSFTLAPKARINVSDQAASQAERLQLFVRGDLSQEPGSAIDALVYVEGDYRAGAASDLRGAVNARGIDIEAGARVEARMDAVDTLSWNAQCEERADLDGDGVLDLFDVDTDGDGHDDESERLAGSDPRDPQSGPTTAWPTGKMNQCVAAFAKGLQTHDGGSIRFARDAQLLDAESAYLPANEVVNSFASRLASCATQACQANGRLVSLPERPSFLKTTSAFRQDIKANDSLVLDAQRTDWERLRIGKQARVRFNVPGEYRLGALELGPQATLELAPGDYWIESLRIGSAAEIQPIGSGTVRLRLRDDLELPWQGRINTDGNEQTGDPANLLVLAEGKVVLGPDSAVSGFVYAGDKLTQQNSSRLYGGALGRDVTLDPLARTHLRMEALRRADFGVLCDLDGDGLGDSRDPDRDGDGIVNDYEVQAGTDPDDAGSVPPDLDHDGIPDSLDDDRDGDGVLNTADIFPDDPHESSDIDGDGVGDNADPDRDGDGISNDYENQVGTDPADAGSVPPDLDKDGIPDGLDDDRDGDGVLNPDDVFPDDPRETRDMDRDGIGDNGDPDRDGDGISNDYEAQLGTDPADAGSVPPDLDRDGVPDPLDIDRDGDGVANELDVFPDDASEHLDLDRDGVGDNADPDRDGDGIANDYETQVGTDPADAGSVPPDLDRDGIPDSLDDDRDGDGVANGDDVFPDDPHESRDLDRDGVGDNADPDRDGDGISNDYEAQVGTDPADAGSVPPDLDRDGIPDSLDADRDGDGVANGEDVFPDDPHESRDLDRDGMGDNGDPDRDGDGISNDYENQVGTDPADAGSVPPDLDRDGIPDSLDDDRDGDGVLNPDDVFPDDPTESRDLDRDGTGDNADPDRDGDGISNDYENQVGTDPADVGSVPPDLDRDGIPDSLDDDRDGDGVLNPGDVFPDDPTESRDLDRDGVGDNADPDRDGDGISNDYEGQVGTDPADAGSVPSDLDRDGVPDSLDDDRDGDGVFNPADVFPDDPRETSDLDGDGTGDNADPDRDGDGIVNDYETQVGTDPNNRHSTPPDQDKDGIPDSLDADRDGDGVNNDQDALPDDPTETRDLDRDGMGDNSDPDRDGDGISNDYESQVGTDPGDAGSVPPDLDRDGIPDSLDDDRDGDGVPNGEDVFPDDPHESRDLDRDGVGDNSDPDRDGDGISNDYEGQVGTDPADAGSVPPDLDRDGVPDSLDDDRDGDGVANGEDVFPDDPHESRDLDRDGVGDNSDPDRDGDGIVNDYEAQVGTDPADAGSVPPDLDKDGIPDSLDDDRDGDGVANAQDAFPDDATESADLDRDGVGDNADPDRDGDGISNDYEAQLGTDPADAASTPVDRDKDGTPDSLDSDRDGDGVANGDDVFPDDATESTDLDRDGIGDNADTDRDGDGASNDEETAAGTSPDDAADFPDRQAPDLDGAGPEFISVNEDTISLTGSVSDSGSGVARLEFGSDRFPEARFAVNLQDGQWSASVPLLEGINLLTLHAYDRMGNQAQLLRTVERMPPAGDIALTIDYPQSGSTVQEASLVVRGLLRSDNPAQRLEVLVNGQVASLSATEQVTEFRFQSAALTLQPGSNQLVVQGWVDQRSIQRTVLVTYRPPQTNFSPPSFDNLAPVDGSQLAERTFYLTGQVFAEAGLDSVTLNGRSLPLREAGAQLLDLREMLAIAEGQDSFSAELLARDRSGQEVRRALSWQLDQDAPQIVLEQPLVELPATNRVSEQPFSVSGILREANLASFRVNDNDVALEPSTQPGEYRFATRVNLPLGQAASVSLQARDQAGNQLRREYSLELAAQAAINWVIPTEGTELLNRGDPISLQVAARIEDLSGQLRPSAQLLSATGEAVAEVELSGDTTLKSATLQVPAQSGQYRLLALLQDADQQVLAQSSRAIAVVTPEQVPVALERIAPANGESAANPNEFITLYFNQSIDVSKLEVRVFETANGKSYVDLDGLGSSELLAQGYQLVDVSRNHQTVEGKLSVLPGDQVVAFYPEQDLAYNGEVSVEVRYDGQELQRIRYRTRPLPTFISGVVLDQLQQPVVNIEVRIAELGRSTRTNRDGAFNFGFGDSAEQAIPGGRYQLQLNPQQSSLSHGSDSRTITVQGGVLNDLGHLQLAQLNPTLPHVPLRGGERFSLLDGEYQLDLSGARLLFPDGQQQGDAHVQMLGFGELPYPVEPLAMPFWMYALQPAGIAVEGPFSVDLAALRLSDSLDYLPEDGTYVAMVGLDREAGRIVPVGAGVIGNYRIRSVGTLALDNLALVGFALVGAEAQPALAAYANGEINLRQLQAELYRLNKGQ